MTGFPKVRMRRMRRTASLRQLVREARLSPGQLIWPLFIKESGEVTPVPVMPGVQQHPLKEVPDLALRARELNLGGVLLFGLPEHKDPTGTSAYAEQGVVQEAVRAMKATAGDLVVITDVCLCEYTSHGHCGILEGETVNNDATLELLQRVAVSHAQAGADVVAPSDMMDGRVGAIRSALDQAGLEHTPILSYAMDPGNGDEALREVELDFEEGADMVMVKPGMPCLDIVRRVKERFGGPVAVYQVSGEFSMIKLADEAGALDGTLAMREALLAMRRAGADIIVTYAAPEITFD